MSNSSLVVFDVFKYQYSMQFLNHATLVQYYIYILMKESILSANMVFWVTLCFVVSVSKVVHFTFSGIQISQEMGKTHEKSTLM
jgi:hypothetical protein